MDQRFCTQTQTFRGGNSASFSTIRILRGTSHSLQYTSCTRRFGSYIHHCKIPTKPTLSHLLNGPPSLFSTVIFRNVLCVWNTSQAKGKLNYISGDIFRNTLYMKYLNEEGNLYQQGYLRDVLNMKHEATVTNRQKSTLQMLRGFVLSR
jgi:hypothetical protein